MASYEVRSIYLVCTVDRAVAETQVRAGETTRLLRVVREVCLAILVSIVTDNLNRVLVSTNGTVSTQTIELSLEQVVATHWDLLFLWERSECNVIYDTNSEVVLRLWQLKVLEYSNDLSWSSIRRTETITATYNQWLALVIVESRLNVEVQWLTLCTWLLSTVKNSDALNCSWDSLLQEVNREWTEEVNCNHTDLLALLVQVVDSLTSWLCSRTHQDDDVLSILSTIVVEEVILTTSDLSHLLAVLLYNLRDCIIVSVRSLTVCEECLRVLSSTASYRALWSQSTVAEVLDELWLNQWTDVFHIHLLDLVVLMRSTETVEEVDERNLCLQSSQVRNCRKVHNLLNRT